MDKSNKQTAEKWPQFYTMVVSYAVIRAGFAAVSKVLECGTHRFNRFVDQTPPRLNQKKCQRKGWHFYQDIIAAS